MIRPSLECRIDDVTVHPATMEELDFIIADAIDLGEKCVVANHNLHSLYLYRTDERMRAFYDIARVAQIDGMPVVWMCRALGHSVSAKHRVTYADWIYDLMRLAAQKRWRVFYLGSRPGIATSGAEILRNRYAGLQLKVRDGYFDARKGSAEAEAVLDDIEQYRPDLLMVGMSMPRQEHWILENIDRLTAKAILPCGAAIDYVAGIVPTPPRWSGRLGLEWAFRLVVEPRRLARRYLIEPWHIMPMFLRALARRAKRRVSGAIEATAPASPGP